MQNEIDEFAGNEYKSYIFGSVFLLLLLDFGVG